MLFLNLNSKIETETLKIGDTTVSQVPSAKLLGITIDDNQSWASQINGVGGIIPSLNSRLFLIQRTQECNKQRKTSQNCGQPLHLESKIRVATFF